jgi:class 3 adenylate cyclase
VSGLRKVLARLIRVRRCARLKRRRRLAAKRLRRHELTVLACDLRGFTAFLEAADPEKVVALLRDYYSAVAEVVATFGATIKDHAGDGVLVLVGANGPSDGHARRAVQLAVAIRERADAALLRARGPEGSVTLGIGIASGDVTVGEIEAGSRLESIAVGTPVNLAARLCARAGSGQILLDEGTATLIGAGATTELEPLEAVRLKGFARAVRVFEVRDPAATRLGRV